MVDRNFAPYTVRPSSKTMEEVIRTVNRQCFECYSSNYSLGALGLDGKVVVNPLFSYERLLQQLCSLGSVTFLTMEELVAGKALPDSIRIATRHDIDTDIVTAMEIAKLENRYGVRSTFYVLHTAWYYGDFEHGTFYRNEALAALYRELQDLGHEVGLHNDPLSIFQELKIDGAQAMVEEINWLRSQGIRIAGTAGHSHYSLCGAQSFEIYKGRVRNYVMPAGQYKEKIDVDEVVFKGKWAPLHVLDEKELQLHYIAHDAYGVPRYLGVAFEIGCNSAIQTWNSKTDFRQRGLKNGPQDLPSLELALTKIRPGEAFVFLHHPCYYGARHRADVAPPRRLESVSLIRNSKLGWPTYEPGSVVAVAVDENRRQVSQSINFANEYGVISKPFKKIEAKALKVLVLGGKNFDGRAVGAPDQFEQQLEKKLRKLLERPAHVRSFAFPGMGVARYSWWYQSVRNHFRSNIVLMGIDSLASIHNHPDLWPEDQLPQRAAVGRFLEWCPDSRGVRFAQWKRHRDVRSEVDIAGLVVGDSDDEVAGIPVFQYLSACYRYLAGLVRKDGGVPFVVMEDEGQWALEQYCIRDPARFSAAVRQRVEKIGWESGIEVIDPHPVLHSWQGPGSPLTVQGLWSSVGHRLVAELVAEVVSMRSHCMGAA